MNNVSGSDKLCNLIANRFIPIRGQKISGKKWQIFRALAKTSAFIGYRQVEIHGTDMRAILWYFFLAFQKCLPPIFSG